MLILHEFDFNPLWMSGKGTSQPLNVSARREATLRLRRTPPRLRSARSDASLAKNPSTPQPSQRPVSEVAREKLRKEFPFLGSPDCPLELKALVTDRVTSYHTYQDTWPQLFTAGTHEECAQVAGRIVNAYIDNRRTWEELNYYQEHHRVLGHHPIFRQFAKLRSLHTMSLRSLLRREKQVRNNIWRVKSEMKKATKPDLEQARRDRLRGYQAELAEIQRLLGEE